MWASQALRWGHSAGRKTPVFGVKSRDSGPDRKYTDGPRASLSPDGAAERWGSGVLACDFTHRAFRGRLRRGLAALLFGVWPGPVAAMPAHAQSTPGAAPATRTTTTTDTNWSRRPEPRRSRAVRRPFRCGGTRARSTYRPGRSHPIPGRSSPAAQSYSISGADVNFSDGDLSRQFQPVHRYRNNIGGPAPDHAGRARSTVRHQYYIGGTGRRYGAGHQHRSVAPAPCCDGGTFQTTATDSNSVTTTAFFAPTAPSAVGISSDWRGSTVPIFELRRCRRRIPYGLTVTNATCGRPAATTRSLTSIRRATIFTGNFGASAAVGRATARC